MKENKVIAYQQSVLKALSGKINNFYLAGGTALSLFYFQHRLSVDLDFFTPNFDPEEISRIAGHLEKSLKVKIKLIGQTLKKETAKMMVYNIYFSTANPLKLDFVEDFNKPIKRTKVVDGVNILSLEDIYIRKLYAITGYVKSLDKIGRTKLIGGRSDAKDFYDVYFLSHTFVPLSKFVGKYCNATTIEGIIRWFRTFDRMSMMDGILMLDTNRKVYYKNIEKHFKKELDKIIEQQVGEI